MLVTLRAKNPKFTHTNADALLIAVKYILFYFTQVFI